MKCPNMYLEPNLVNDAPIVHYCIETVGHKEHHTDGDMSWVSIMSTKLQPKDKQ